MTDEQKPQRATKFGTVTYYSNEKGAFVAELSKVAEEFFIPRDFLFKLEEQNIQLSRGQMIQFELEGGEIIDIKPLGTFGLNASIKQSN